jgi:hypothetical protein
LDGLRLGWVGPNAGAAAEPMDRDVRPKGIDFDRDPEARRRFMEDAP